MNNNKGFTLIELLVVVAIIGILASIAIPQFYEYRRRGFDSRVLSDLRNAATGEEAYFADNELYVTCATDAASSGTCSVLPGYEHSSGVILSMTAADPASADARFFTGSAYHGQGSRNTVASAYTYNSSLGGLQQTGP